MLVFFCLVPAARGQTATLRGFVSDGDNGEPLPGVNVSLTSGAGLVFGGATNSDGAYTIPGLDPGRYVLRAAFVGYQTRRDTLQLGAGEIRTASFALLPETTGLAEVVVEDELEGAGAASLVAGMQVIRPKDIDLIPAPDVSGDLANYLAVLPGVVSVGDQGGQFFVRGGEPTQNLILLDGIPVYQPFHLVGFYSAFPSGIVHLTDVYAGAYGASYGGWLSSVVSIASRNGNKRRFQGEASVAPLMSGIRMEGPIVPGRVSLLLSGRMSVIEHGASRLVDRPLPYVFGDQFGKLHATLGPSSQMSLTALNTYDRGTIAPPDETGAAPEGDEVVWKNQALGWRFVLLPTTLPVQAELLLSTSSVENTFGPESEPSRASSASQFHFGANVTHFQRTWDFNWGLSLTAVRLDSRLSGAFQDQSTDVDYVTEVSAYLEPEFGPDDGLRIRPGLRIQSFPSNGRTYLEPRLRVLYQAGRHGFSAAGGTYHQEIAGLADRRDAGDVFTAWTVAPDRQVPAATHALVGYQVKFDSGVRLSAETYVKRLRDLSIAEWTAFPRFTIAFQPADGSVRGFDLRLEIARGVFYGFVNYGYSRVEYVAEQEALQHWFGEPTYRFSPPHDRRHQLNALGSITVGGFEISARWQLGTGLPFSEALGFDEFILLAGPTDVATDPGRTRVLYGLPYGGRLPAYHRLDISCEWTATLRGRTQVALFGGLTNAYDRKNAFYIDLFTLQRLDQLPFIPSFGLKVAF